MNVGNGNVQAREKKKGHIYLLNYYSTKKALKADDFPHFYFVSLAFCFIGKRSQVV